MVSPSPGLFLRGVLSAGPLSAGFPSRLHTFMGPPAACSMRGSIGDDSMGSSGSKYGSRGSSRMSESSDEPGGCIEMQPKASSPAPGPDNPDPEAAADYARARLLLLACMSVGTFANHSEPSHEPSETSPSQPDRSRSRSSPETSATSPSIPVSSTHPKRKSPASTSTSDHGNNDISKGGHKLRTTPQRMESWTQRS
jgi:hypothetical protein